MINSALITPPFHNDGQKVPTVILGGYLGAGKTTLVNHLLRHAEGRRIAVLVNDFGDLAIDADLINGRDGTVLNLSGGCVCCSFGSDLLGSLLQLSQSNPRPDVLLIETSGVALPAAVARTARLARDILVEGIIVVLDATTVRGNAADRFMGDTVTHQLHDADLFILNKLDLIDQDTETALRAWLRTIQPTVPVVGTTKSQIPVELVLGMRVEGKVSTGEGWAGRPMRAPLPAPAQFESASWLLHGPVDGPALAASLVEADVVRAKGWLTDLDGRRMLLQLVGRRWTCEPWNDMAQAASPDRLVVISFRGHLPLLKAGVAKICE